VKTIEAHFRQIAGAFAVMILAAVVGCATDAGNFNKDIVGASDEFLLGPEDVLEVNVWRNQDLSRQVIVRPDGMISLPLIGDVLAKGLTANQLATRIAERLKEFKENPSVSVSVKEVNSYYIYVLGEVSKPGKYQLKSFTTVLQAIAVAGGFTLFASKNNLQVIRNSANGDGQHHEIRIRLRYDDLLAGSGEPGNFILRSGDTVVVP
jgi:polysaccharide export outer membrane protein